MGRRRALMLEEARVNQKHVRCRLLIRKVCVRSFAARVLVRTVGVNSDISSSGRSGQMENGVTMFRVRGAEERR